MTLSASCTSDIILLNDWLSSVTLLGVSYLLLEPAHMSDMTLSQPITTKELLGEGCF